MTIDRLASILVSITLIEMMLAIGLGVSLADLIRAAGNWHLIVRAALVNYVLVPATTVGLLLLFDPHPMVAAGFLVLAVCPGAPYGPPFTAIAKGDAPVAVGLMVILAGSSAILAPVLLLFLLPVVAGSQAITVDAAKIAFTLLGVQLLPLCIGVAARKRYPTLANRLQRPAMAASKALNLAAVAVILLANWQSFADIKLRALIGMTALLVACWASGWVLGGRNSAVRKAMTLTASLRNVGVGLVIATGNFADTPAVAATLVYGLFEVLGSLGLAIWWGRCNLARDSA